MKPFSVQTITALTEVITGGAEGSGKPRVGIYRTANEIRQFFGHLNLEMTTCGSRVPMTRNLLQMLNKQEDGREQIARVLEAAADPRDFIEAPEKLPQVLEYLNQRLAFDGYELRLQGNSTRLVPRGSSISATAALRETAAKLDLGSVQADFERAFRQADQDPEDAVTSACSTIESVCKCILDEMGKPYPSKQDVKGLMGEVARLLNLSTGRTDLPPEWEEDIRRILSGLYSVVQGVGALRTHAGDAHGRGRRLIRIDARIARLAVHAASTVSLFYIETWQRTVERQTAQVKTTRG